MMSDELKQVDVRLKLVEGNGVYSDKPITNPEEAISVMADVMAGLDREEVCVINLDSKGHPINFNVVSIGTLNSSFVSGRELFKSAILSNAASMILLHNHPFFGTPDESIRQNGNRKDDVCQFVFRYRDFRPHHCSRKNRGHTEHKRNLPRDI